MIVSPTLAYCAWIPATLIAFRRLPVRNAMLFNFVAGWALLPAARYSEQNASPFPYWILGTSLPSDYFLTKAVVIGFAGLLGVLFFDRASLMRFRLTIWDLAMCMWLVAPILSAIANPGNLSEGCLGELYQFLAWGSPYLIGRLYFADSQSLRLAAKSLVIGGLLYIPLCLFEFLAGPRLYSWLYGYQPFQANGAERWIGFRPIGLLENGNQLGIWMATASLIAIWFWKRKIAPTVLRIPIRAVAASLFAVTLLCQSTGAILLLLALAPFVFVDPRHLSRTVGILLVLGILAFAVVRIGNWFSLRQLVKENPAARAAEGFLKKIGKGSLGWRLKQDETHVNTALEEPILGYGQWNWWREGFERPWSLWLLVFGMYGCVGLISLEALMLIPVLRAVWFPLARSDIAFTNMRHTLAAAILISAIDSLLNSSILLPLLLVIGGMSTWSSHDSQVEVSIEPSQPDLALSESEIRQTAPLQVPKN